MTKNFKLLTLALFTLIMVVHFNVLSVYSESSLFLNDNHCNPVLLSACQNIIAEKQLCERADIIFCQKAFTNCNQTINLTNVCLRCNLLDLTKCDDAINKKKLCTNASINFCIATFNNCSLTINLTNSSCCNYDPTATKVYVKKDPNCVINFLCSVGTTPFKDSCGCGCEKLPSFCARNRDCGTDRFTGNTFCMNGSIFQNFTTFTCNNPGRNTSFCTNSTIAKLRQNCYNGKVCSNGTCVVQTIRCSSNSTCGTNGYVGSPICQNGSVFQNFTTFTCNNPNTINSSCTNSTVLQVKQNCNSNQTCSNGQCVALQIKCFDNDDCGISGFKGNKFCQNGSIFQNFTNFTCNLPGTINSTCSNTTIAKVNLTCASNQTCSNGQCVALQIKCFDNDDCGISGFKGNKFCQNGSIFQNFTNFTCHNAGTINSFCANTTVARINQTCASNQTCSNGQCLSNASQHLTVSIIDFDFLPRNLQISSGTNVIWTNNGQSIHTVTSDNSTELGSIALSPGETYNHTFTTTGTFPYHCIIHPTLMRGNITVV
ncbi:Plastocyanin [uncultured archaeon]|nr:Plastocyanin [uncultured archaeon]